MTFKEGEKLLDEMGVTTKELDEMWEACVLAEHPLISNLNNCGKGWRDLNPNAIKTLPREYNKLSE